MRASIFTMLGVVRYVCVLLTLLTGILLETSTAKAQSAQALFEKAFELIGKHDYATAEQLLRMGLEKDSTNALGHYYLAEVLSKKSSSRDEALKHYRAAASLSPESKEGLDALVKILRLEQTLERERKEEDRITAVRSKQKAVLQNLVGKCYQTRVDEVRGSSVVCSCFSAYVSGDTIESDILRYGVSTKGNAFNGDHTWHVKINFDRPGEIKVEGDHLVLGLWNDYGSEPNSWFRNTASYLASPVNLRGRDATSSSSAKGHLRLYPDNRVRYSFAFNKGVHDVEPTKQCRL